MYDGSAVESGNSGVQRSQRAKSHSPLPLSGERLRHPGDGGGGGGGTKDEK